MVIFEDIQDVEEWLEPLDYIAFWDAIAPYHLTLQGRDHCDGLIASGKVGAGLILSGLKGFAVMELRVAFDLKDRIYTPSIARFPTTIQ